MTKFYATHDADGRDIKIDADISAFDTKAEAEAFLREPYTASNGWDESSTTIEKGCIVAAMITSCLPTNWKGIAIDNRMTRISMDTMYCLRDAIFCRCVFPSMCVS